MRRYLSMHERLLQQVEVALTRQNSLHENDLYSMRRQYERDHRGRAAYAEEAITRSKTTRGRKVGTCAT